MVALAPRLIRALNRFGGAMQLEKGDDNWTCANWALAAFTAPLINPGPFFNYVCGIGAYNDLRTESGIDIGSAEDDRLGAVAADLLRLRNAWQPFDDRPHTVAKTNMMIAVTHELCGYIIRVNGLTLSGGPRRTDAQIATDYQVCMHFPSGPPDPSVDANSRGPNYDHWWLRVCGKVTVETFPPLPDYNRPLGGGRYANRPSHLSFYRDWEQAHDGMTVVRHYVTGLHLNHQTQIERAIQRRRRNNNAPFVAFNARQVWQPDNTQAHCRWCGVAFGLLTRRHHCRSCGYIFCADCSSQQDNVPFPATSNGQNVAGGAGQRVCMTCYTQNN